MEYPKSIQTPKGWQVVKSKAEEAEIMKRFKQKRQKQQQADDVIELELNTESLDHGDS